MSKKLYAPGHEPGRERKPNSGKGFAGREVLAELAHSQNYSFAIERITSSMACTDIRELLRLIPQCFRGVVRIDISRGDDQPFISASVNEDRVIFTGRRQKEEGQVITEVPLVLKDAHERAVGSMRVASDFPLFLDIYKSGDQTDTEKVLGMLGSLIARTIDAKLDGLTALPMRKYFDIALEEHVAAFHQKGRNFSLICLDIDHFKKINDEFGHDAGDQVLTALARILQNGTRARLDCIDVAFRTGGEEFGILLSGVSVDEATGIADRLRSSIKAHDFGIGRPVTCSFGVCDMKEVQDGTIYKLADQRLYEAKVERDSVVSSRGSSHVRMKAVRMDKAGNE